MAWDALRSIYEGVTGDILNNAASVLGNTQLDSRTYKEAIASPLGATRLSVRVDPDWPYRALWEKDNPIGSYMTCTFVDLEQGISENRGVNYADQEVIGRAEAYKTYVGSANREIPLSFKFQVQGQKAGSIVDAIKEEVYYPALWLNAFTNPVYDPDQDVTHAPPPVILHVGHLFHGRCVITDASIQWEAPFEPTTLLPYAATVEVQFAITHRFVTRTNFKGPGR